MPRGLPAGEQPALHVGHPRPRRPLALDAVRARGHRSGLEDGVHVADEQEPRSRAPQAPDDEVAELPLPGPRQVRGPGDIRVQLREPARDEVGDPVDAVGRVRAAVEVHERREIGEVGVVQRLHGGAEAVDRDRHRRRVYRSRALHTPPMAERHAAEEREIELLELRVLDGPNRFFTRPAIKIEFVDPRPGAAAEAPERRAWPSGELYVALGLPRAHGRVATQRGRDARPRSPTLGGGARSARPSARQPPGSRSGAAAGGASSRRSARWRSAAAAPAAPTVPVVAITGTNGKSTTTRLLAHIPASAGDAGGDDELGRHLRRPATLVEAGDWTGFGGAARDARRAGLERRCSRRRAAASSCAASAYGANDVAVVTNVSADHLGLRGIDTLDELAETKAAIVRITKPGRLGRPERGRSSDWRMRRETKARWYAVTLDPASPAIEVALDRGGRAAVLERRLAGPARGRPAAGTPRAGRRAGGHVRRPVALQHRQRALRRGRRDALGLPRAKIVRGLRTFAQDSPSTPGASTCSNGAGCWRSSTSPTTRRGWRA